MVPSHAFAQGNLVLVLGLAGSGKSHLIRLLRQDFCIEEGFALAEQTNINLLKAALSEGKHCIVSERKYRSSQQRSIFLEAVRQGLPVPPAIHFICFENDLAAANHNCRHRGNKARDPGGKEHIAQNNADAIDYEIPDGAVVVKIHGIAPQGSQLPLAEPPTISVPQADQRRA